MGLFTSPVTFTVNTIARIFSFRAQLPSVKGVVGEWIEAAAALARQSKMIAKHDFSQKSTWRSLLSYSVMQPIADPTILKPIVVNFTVVRHPEHTNAQIDEAMEVMAQAITPQAFRDAFILGSIYFCSLLALYQHDCAAV